MVQEKIWSAFPKSNAINQTRYILALAYYKENKFKKSIQTYKKAFKASGDKVDPLSYFYIGMAYYKINNYKDALTWLVNAKESISNLKEEEKKNSENIDKNIALAIDEIELAIPNAHYYLGNYRKGLELYLDYLKKYPDSNNVPYGLFQVGNIYLKLDNMESAQKYFDELMNRYRGNFWSEQAQIILENQKIKNNYEAGK